MSRTDRDVTRVVRSWLEEGVTALPDRVLDAVLDQLPATPQRRSWWTAWRPSVVNSNTVRFGLAAAAVVLVAIVGIYLVGGPNVGGPPDSAPSPSAELTPFPTATPMPRLSGQESLAAGRYRVDPTIPMVVTVEVPDGWGAGGPWVVFGPKGFDAPDGMAIRFYTVRRLFANPLSPDEGFLPEVGPGVEDLVNAMVNHPDWPTTGAEAITIDGYAGQVVHLTLPPDTSDATPFYFFGDEIGGQYGWVAGQLFDIYVIDVDGERLVIDAHHYPGTSEADLAAQRAVLDSIQLSQTP